MGRISATRSGGLALLVAIAVGGAAASPAAACDQTRTGRPAHARVGQTRAPFIVGDSTMFFSVQRLASLGIQADARVCRIFFTGTEILAARRKAGTLPQLSILALGANGDVYDGNIDQAFAAIGPGRLLGLVTPREPKDADVVIRRAAAAHPHQILLMDWASYSARHPNWFAGDGLHVNLAGARAFADFVRRRADPLMPPSASRLGLGRSAAGAKACGEVHPSGATRRVFIVHGRDRVTCRRARELAERSPLRPIPGWRAYAWHAVYGGPWSDVYRREDGRALVATRRR